MQTAKIILAVALTSAVTTVVPLSSAAAASSGLVAKRSGYIVTPTMMHAIDVIVAEEMKMRHRRR